MSNTDNDIKIAVLQVEFNGLREQHKAHAQTIEQKLDAHSTAAEKSSEKLMNKIEPISNWITENREVPNKVKTLWDAHNNQKGFLKASSMVGGGVGAIVIACLDWVIRR